MLDFNFTVTTPGAEDILQRLTTLEDKLMSVFTDITEKLDTLGELTTNIANDIEGIKAQIVGGMTGEEAIAVRDRLAERVNALRALDESNP